MCMGTRKEEEENKFKHSKVNLIEIQININFLRNKKKRLLSPLKEIPKDILTK